MSEVLELERETFRITEVEPANDRMELCQDFWDSLTIKERKRLKKAKTADKLLNAIFTLDSPQKIKEALTLIVTDCYQHA